MTAPQALDRAGIARRIPHSGTMCLLENLRSWDELAIHCTTATHAHPDNPLGFAKNDFDQSRVLLHPASN